MLGDVEWVGASEGGDEVRWHQDFPFQPHTNTSTLATLTCIEDVTEEMGPLQVIPGVGSAAGVPLDRQWGDMRRGWACMAGHPHPEPQNQPEGATKETHLQRIPGARSAPGANRGP